MSYDIKLMHLKTEETALMKHPQYILGSNVPAKMIDGVLVPIMQTEASLSVTYNYSNYYNDAAKGDARFLYDDGNYGIWGLSGKTPRESIPMLTDMISRIQAKYKDAQGNWILGTKIRHKYLKNGVEVPVTGYVLTHASEYMFVAEEYTISEGDVSNYWIATAANAIRPLSDMLVMATDNLLESDVVWCVS